MLQSSLLNRIKTMLLNFFENRTLVSEVFLIGSVLDKAFNDINDVDIVQRLDENNKIELVNYSILIQQLKIDFYFEFKKSLHVTTFTCNENNEFNIFVSKNNILKII